MKKILLSFVILSAPIVAQAAGFALIEQSASGMGNAFAGGGAIAEDASTIFFNPAGMSYIEGTQLVGAIHLIKPTVDFNGSISGTGKAGGDGGDAGDLSFAPNFYYKRDLTNTVKFGLGINAPFGLKTEYDATWMGRFQAIKSEVKTININPAIAFKLNDQLSVGAGISAMWAKAELTRAFNLGGPSAETTVKIKGDDWGFGFNIGAIYQATADTRLSVAYRSKVNQHLEGDSTSPLIAALNTNVTAAITLPETFSASAFSKLNDTWDLMGDVTWTRWSQFKELRVDFANPVLTDAVTAENWSNTLRYSIGANYHYSDDIKFRAGLAYDEEAISDQFRTARIPGNDRKWVSLGANWKVSPSSSIDVGYAHLFISDASINKNEGAGNGTLTGTYDGSVDILSAQYTHNF
ncbi:OmpP1/FadL family transporter [Methylotenera versatilis]|uniref:Membrane protein involved in aromatic hydrocarbon degradation n=1 Tax=Methylotenera versatilis (strain 301) TaxID=666681 RepID=D7DMQ6_METV0|nr:outer membrane protein transport protein [Methylotenera versatilis]ADI30833.1 membrane protein involved in aromatic hydrocarbon degradation [Methylotenera versatilis 301]